MEINLQADDNLLVTTAAVNQWQLLQYVFHTKCLCLCGASGIWFMHQPDQF